MNTKHVELWRRLENFNLDATEAALPFSARLARENQWSPEYTRRVIREYKRFAFLAAAAGHPVSPSEDVDQVWHLHLTYSQNYWKVFCPEILGTPFHHNPTQGGRREQAKFEDWYVRTLASYEAFFQEAPPQDIWPTAEARKQERHNFVRVDRESNWVIPKPDWRRIFGFEKGSNIQGASSPRPSPPEEEREKTSNVGCYAGWMGWIGLLVLLFCGTGAMMANGANPFDWKGPEFLQFYVITFLLCFGVGCWMRWSLRRPGPDGRVEIPDLDGYETAYLNGGAVLAVNTAIANLVRQKAIKVVADSRHLLPVTGARPVLEHFLEKQVYHSATESVGGNTLAATRDEAKRCTDKLARDLRARGLVVAAERIPTVMFLPMLLPILVIAMGTIKILIGTTRSRPVEFLVILCLLSVIPILAAFARLPRRTRLGDAVLREMQAKFHGPRKIDHGAADMPAAEFAAVLGLFGMTALAEPGLASLRKELRPLNTGGSSSSCGSSGCGGGGCGGGGCGGGCGGCGS